MQLVQTVAPTQEPITLEEAKAFLRIIDNDEDLLIATLISTVREHVENITNRQLENATFELYDCFLPYKLPKNPIVSIDKIEYMDAVGDYVELDSDTYYLYENNGVGYINYSEIPTTIDHKKAFKLTLTCGYSEVPEAIKSYMKVKISTLYENREEFVIGASISQFGGKFIEDLLSSYKIRSI